MASKNNRLSKSEVKKYHEEGWIGPFKLISVFYNDGKNINTLAYIIENNE